MNDDCTVLVASCDAYRDVQGPFVRLFRKYWRDCPFELVLATDVAGDEPSGFDRIIVTGEGVVWGERVAAALRSIETPYILLLMDDYYVKSPVDTPLILRRLSEAKEKDALNYRLCPDPPQAIKNHAYSISCKAGIWNRQFLLDLALKVTTPWDFERRGSFMFNEEDPRPIMVAAKSEFPFLDAVHKGYWERAAVDLLGREGIGCDFAKRGLPPVGVRLKEALKKVIFNINPNLVTRLQNRICGGIKGKSGGVA